jgi:hypothetical protein
MKRAAMRTITPVVEWEVREEAGAYLYSRDGQPGAALERWVIYRLPDGSTVIRAERESLGDRLLVEVRSVAASILGVRSLEVHSQSSVNPAVADVRARYSFSKTGARVEREVSGVPLPPQVVPIDRPVIVFPQMRLFEGPAIATIAARGRGQPLLVLFPDLSEPDDSEKLLAPVVEDRHARLVEEAAIELGDRPYAARRFEYGTETAAGSGYWLSESNRLLRYAFVGPDGARWEATLDEVGESEEEEEAPAEP